MQAIKALAREHVCEGSSEPWLPAGMISTEISCAGYTVKPVLSDHSKKDKKNVLKTNGSLMKVLSIAKILLTCIKR